MKRVCHITTVHKPEDVRIFGKECTSLARNGFEVHLISHTDHGDYVKNDVKIHSLGKAVENRLKRMTKSVGLALEKALALKADIYHLHDPELLRISKKLQANGAKVIFDAHEDTVRQILAKPYLPKYSKGAVSGVFRKFEKQRSSSLNAVIGATPFISSKFGSYGIKTETIINYPLLREFNFSDNQTSVRNQFGVCYVGGVSINRGIREMIELARHKPEITVHVAGPIWNDGSVALIDEAKNLKNFKYEGILDRSQVVELYRKCSLGLLPLHPEPNYLDAIPVKMFEYMAAGLAIASSPFENWKSYILGNQTGIFVQFENYKTAANQIFELLQDVGQMTDMASRGFDLVQNTYNWETEEQKLISFYNQVLS